YTNFKFIDNFNDFKNQFHSTKKNEIGLEVNGIYLSYTLPIQYHYKDVVKGEIYKPFHVVPAISIQFKQSVYISNPKKNKNISVFLSHYSNVDINSKLLLKMKSKKSKRLTFQKTLDFNVNKNEKNKEIVITNDHIEGEYIINLFENEKVI